MSTTDRRYLATLALRVVLAVLVVLAVHAVLIQSDHLPFGKAGFNIIHLGEEMFSTSQFYYRQQRPLVEAAAREFHMHWYCTQTQGIDSLDLGATHLTTLRMQAFAEMLRKHGRDDFRLEKDKRAMNDFFLQNHLPVSPMVGRWEDNGTLVGDLRSGKVLDSVGHWPVFLKVVHMHGDAAGTLGSTRSVTRKDLTEGLDDVVQWVNGNWVTKSDDMAKPWGEAGNEITRVVPPGYLIQEPAFAGDSFETRVWVVFGRAFIGSIPGCVVMRGETPTDAKVTAGMGLGSLLWAHEFGIGNQACRDRWVMTENHYACAWPLAERVARLMMLDMVRVDIFLGRGRPMDCKVNEISLSSGYPLFAFSRPLGALWAEGLMDGWPSIYGDADSPPIYTMREEDIPNKGVTAMVARMGTYWTRCVTVLLMASVALNVALFRHMPGALRGVLPLALKPSKDDL